ncbi:MAG TPA: PLP-dependent aminotransferase family protein [Noviherbaspirillum sp.]
MFEINPDSSTPLVIQIVEGMKDLITSQKLRSGTKIPSIRQFADAHKVSASTVVEAYDRLVAEGFLVARQSAGFYVRTMSRGLYREEKQSLRNIRFDPLWFVRRVWESASADVTPGYGWIPDEWLDGELIRRAMRSLASKPSAQGTGYGHPKGLNSLRLKACDWLAEREIAAAPDQVLLTTGASHALELVSEYLLRPGDAVLVDEPGYSVMMSNLRARGARLVGVPWTPAGPDLNALEKLATEHAPRAFFTNPRLHNPTGASYSPATAHRVLQLAERFNFIIVEDDVSADLDISSRRPLACLDQLNRVIYVTSFSKSISPRLRTGFIAADPDAIEDITQIKMMTGLTSSEVTERLTLEILNEGRHRKQIKSLRDKLAEAQDRVCRHLVQSGLELFTEPQSGLFVWARHPDFEDSNLLCNEALDANLLLAPGHLFMVNGQPSPWIRFNVGFADRPPLFAFLQGCGTRQDASMP